MAQYNRYVSVPHLTYNMWRNATLGNGYNVDGYAQNQCWDYCALLWWQYGMYLITRPGGNGTAYDCWAISRNANARYPFVAVTGVQNIRRGDVIVTKAPTSKTGHICFADENYRSSGDRSRLWCLGQRQRGSAALPVTRDEISIRYFVGIFRNITWGGSSPEPPTPTPSPTGDTVYNKDRYKFVLFNKIKGRRNGQRNL